MYMGHHAALKTARAALLVSVAALLVTTSAGFVQATVYNIGPGQTYTRIIDMPWESLAAGDTVNIYYKSGGYQEKFGVFTQGTASNPITVHGVPDGSGNLPIIDGSNAISRSAAYLNYSSETRQVLKIGGSTTPFSDPTTPPTYVIIENLEVKSGRDPYTFTDKNGAGQTYTTNASSIRSECGEHITIRNCILHDSANNLLTSGPTKEFTIEGCYIYDGGYSAAEHDSYCETAGITYQYNRYGPLRTQGSSSEGIALKDRSAGTIVRYNWIEGGVRQVNLVESYTPSYPELSDPRYGVQDRVYGNVLIMLSVSQGNEQFLYGGDMGTQYEQYYRSGPLKAYNNTCISQRTDNTRLVRLKTASQSADFFNNIWYVPAGTAYVLSSSIGTCTTSHNWFQTGYALTGATEDGTNISGSAPGFVDYANQDFHITTSSACKNAGMAIPSALLPDFDVTQQYVKHRSYEARPTDATIDIGAYEYASGPAPLSITTASLPNGTTGVAYSQTLAATGGTTPYTWAISSGSLPSGLSLVTSTGDITGTPSATGTSNFTARVTDNVSATATKALSIVVTAPAALSITTSSLPGGTVGVAYSQTLAATGGVTPYTWAIASGSLPSGLSLNSSTGAITGTPSASGTSNFTARVTDSQVPTGATATKALSIVVTVSTEPTYRYASSDTEVGTTSTAYVNKLTYTFTPTVSDDYLVIGFGEFKAVGTTAQGMVRMTIDGTVEGETIMAPQSNTQYFSFTVAKYATLSAASHTINIDHASSSASYNCYLRNARVLAIRKASLVYSSNAADTAASLTTTLTDYVTLNFTPATAGDYLLVWSGEETAAATNIATTVQAKLNGTVKDEMINTSKIAGDWVPFMSYAVATSLPASQQTITVAAKKASGTKAAQIRRARAVAIRLSGGRFSGYQTASDDTESTTSSTTWVQKLTKSWSVATAGNWAVLASIKLADSSTSYNAWAQFQIDNATTCANPGRRPVNAADYMNAGCMDVRSLATGTRTVDVDFDSNGTGGTAKIKYVHLVTLPLD
jgi:hypothetical protein